jgi:hypothetical protein
MSRRRGRLIIVFQSIFDLARAPLAAFDKC